MAKAYDRVDWRFLIWMMLSFGFSDRVYKLISKCVEAPWFLIMMNGTYKRYFKYYRRLWQSDPIVPYLFILMEEVLTWLLKKGYGEGRIGKFFYPRGTPLISHLLYADDLLIFANGEKRTLKNILKTLGVYERWTSQVINEDKSTIFFPIKFQVIENEAYSIWRGLWRVVSQPNT